MLKKYKIVLVLIFAVFLNIIVLMWITPNSVEPEEFDIQTTLKKIEHDLNMLNTKMDDQKVILENIQIQRAINDLLLTIE